MDSETSLYHENNSAATIKENIMGQFDALTQALGLPPGFLDALNPAFLQQSYPPRMDSTPPGGNMNPMGMFGQMQPPPMPMMPPMGGPNMPSMMPQGMGMMGPSPVPSPNPLAQMMPPSPMAPPMPNPILMLLQQLQQQQGMGMPMPSPFPQFPPRGAF